MMSRALATGHQSCCLVSACDPAPIECHSQLYLEEAVFILNCHCDWQCDRPSQHHKLARARSCLRKTT
eukprot:COSAG01_NODE_44552_length_417_cov_66.566038_1_plen_67_part_10